MRASRRLIPALALSLAAVLGHASPASAAAYSLDIQAHRGGRALGPDNSMETFRRAIELAVPTLELDVQGRGGKLFVSHEPDFVAGSVPLLDDVLALAASARYPVRVSVEVKAQRGTSEEAADVGRLVAEALDRNAMAGRAIIESFEPAALRAVNSVRTDIGTAILVRPGDDFGKALDASRATILSPRLDALTEGRVQLAHSRGVKVIPWVVNEPEDMERLASWGVDGLITDHPELAMKEFAIDDDEAVEGARQDSRRSSEPLRAAKSLRDVRTLAIYPFTSGGNVDTFCTTLFTQEVQERELFDRIVDPLELPITQADGQPFSPRELMTYLREEAAAQGADAFVIAEGKWYDWGFRMEFRVIDAVEGNVLWQGGWASGLSISGPSAKRELVTKAARAMKRVMDP